MCVSTVTCTFPPFYESLNESSSQHCHLQKLPYLYLHLKMICLCVIVELIRYITMAAQGDQQFILIHLFNTHVGSWLYATTALGYGDTVANSRCGLMHLILSVWG